MGDPKKQRPKFSTPNHPWNKERIEEEKKVTREYALKNKSEIYKLTSKLRQITSQAKKLTVSKTEQSEKEKKQLMDKLQRLGLLGENAHLDEVLALTLKDIMERRLQSLVFRKGMSKTMNQARQFITHRHIMINGKKVTSPNYIVPKAIENSLQYAPNSNLKDEMHPERMQPKVVKEKPEDKKTEKKVKEEKTTKPKETKTDNKKDNKATKK